jgi:transcriptional regulator with XRE-family HTH domain
MVCIRYVKLFERQTMKSENLPYNGGDAIFKESVIPMTKGKIPMIESGERFGERLARLRQSVGYSQRVFASEVGISQRMVVYYEKECERIPVWLLPMFAKALKVTTDQLLGLEKEEDSGHTRDNRLWRRFSQVEKLPSPKRKQIVQILDAFLESEKRRRPHGSERSTMTTIDATSEVLMTAFRALPKKAREAVVDKMLSDKEFREDLMDAQPSNSAERNRPALWGSTSWRDGRRSNDDLYRRSEKIGRKGAGRAAGEDA